MNPAQPQPEQPPVGIDLGTTYSVVAFLDGTGRPTTVLNRAGDLLTPSAVCFEDGEAIVGREALKNSVFAPDAYADCFKRDMGRSAFRRPILGHEVPPEVVSGFLLARLRADAERRLGPVRRVVVTVPAFFDEGRRKATQDAGRLAGLEVLDIINEPTAAAVAFGHQRSLAAGATPLEKPQERLLVYDLGGGTFDVTILEIRENTFRTLATDGDVQLGGKDWDERLVNYLAEAFLAEHGVDPRSDPQDAAQLWIDVQEAKHTLSERGRALVTVHHAGIRMRQEVTRPMFEDLTRDLLERTESTTALVMKQAGLEWDAVDRVLLVGGSTRMPMVLEMLRCLTGKEPDRSVSADEVVAQGAALYAGMIASGEAAPEKRFHLVNVNSHSLGVVGLDPRSGQRVSAVLIPKNTPLPCHKAKQFKTYKAGQQTVKVAVVEGENPRPEHCIQLGQCVIRDLPPGLPEGTPVEVEYHYAANGRIAVYARVPGVRQSAHVEIQRDQSRDLKDLDYWRKLLARRGAAGGQAPGDRPGMVRRLDELYARVGASAARGPVPPELERSRRAAVAAAEEARRAKEALARAEGLRQSAASPTEAARLSADAAQARTALAAAENNAAFAALVLGREAAAADVLPPEAQALAAEIRQLQERLGG